MGVYGHRSRVCTERWLWKKIPCHNMESKLPQRRTSLTLYQLSYIPILWYKGQAPSALSDIQSTFLTSRPTFQNRLTCRGTFHSVLTVTHTRQCNLTLWHFNLVWHPDTLFNVVWRFHPAWYPDILFNVGWQSDKIFKCSLTPTLQHSLTSTHTFQ